MAAIPPAGLLERQIPKTRARFHRLTVAAVEPLTADSIAVTFAVPPQLAADYAFTPGQHLTIRSDHGAPGTRRSYSIASPAGGPLRVGIKRLPGGAFSGWAVDELRPGETLDVMTPAGEFGTEVRPGEARRIVALAAGSGITPVLSIVASVLAGEPGSAVTLLYGSRSAADIMFAEDLADLKDRHPARFQLLHFLSREPQAAPLRAGRLDAARLATLLEPLVPYDADAWFLCGPAEAVADWQSALAAAGIDPSRVHSELFHAGPLTAAPLNAAPRPRPAAPAGPVRTLRFTLDGRSSELRLDPEETVLDGVLRTRPDAPFACRGGVCGTCRATLTAGEVAMDANFALEPDELERGFVLTCQARPLTDEVAVDYDR